MATSDILCDNSTLETFPQDAKEDRLLLPFRIEPILPYAMHSLDITNHTKDMELVVRKCVPTSLLQASPSVFSSTLLHQIPLVVWKHPETSPGCIEFCVLCQASKEDFLETKLEAILKDWLVPGRSTPLLSVRSLYFHWDLFPDRSFLVTEVKCLIETGKDLAKALLSIPSLSLQLTSSLKSRIALKEFFHQRPLLQDLKHAQIHEQLVLLIEKLPHLFTTDLFLEMGRLFSLCNRSFFEPRHVKLITKILAFHSLMRTSLLRMASSHPEKRHLEARYIRTDLTFQFGSKSVLGLVLGVAPLNRHEFFEEGHVLQAAQTLLPNVGTVKGSFYSYQGPQDPVHTLYVELEKKDGSSFSAQEICLLKGELKEELKRRIERLVPAVFMARNEEETMRNILILSQELRHLSDLPQVMISLDTQTASEIMFTVILVRLGRNGQPPLSKHFDALKSEARFLPDRVQQVGMLKKNTPKEANVFHLCLPRDPSLLRADYSINFYLARSKVVSILSKAIGSFRDYNGGMLVKQGELFYEFQDAFSFEAKKNPELLENFFFSINPIEMQATLPLYCLETLFKQFQEAQKVELLQKEQYFLKIEEREKQLFATIKTQGSSFKEILNTALISKGLCSKSLVQTSVQMHGALYTGLIFPHAEEKKQQSFIEVIHEVLRNWIKGIQNLQVIKLSFLELPQSFDPRLAGDEYSHTITKMLFEGLTRLDDKGRPHLAAAQSVEISEDQKHYLFALKKCYWSDGSPVCAQDFEYAWKKILSPTFTSPFAHVFYPIKNARAAKENLCQIEDVGIHALGPTTLHVELEYPTPEFLELTALSTYSPINHTIDKIHPNWTLKSSEEFVCNGPFVIKNMTNHVRCELAKNPFYWDKDHVRLQKIFLSKDSSLAAAEMFANEEIHWLGKPMRPWDDILDQASGSVVQPVPTGVHWCVFNTERFPFHNAHLRQAFDLAIDKYDLVTKVAPNHLAASTPLPLSHTMNHDAERAYGHEDLALELFEKGLKELGLTRKNFPLITLSFVNTPLRENTANYLTKRWKKLFQIPCRAEGFSFNTFFLRTLRGDFQIAGVYWKALIDNPSYTLNIFKYDNLDLNFIRWSHNEYKQLMEAERRELDLIKKIKLLSDAEKLLIRETPLFSLFYEREKNIKKPYLHKVLYSQTTGQVDFKHAYIEKQTKQEF